MLIISDLHWPESRRKLLLPPRQKGWSDYWICSVELSFSSYGGSIAFYVTTHSTSTMRARVCEWVNWETCTKRTVLNIFSMFAKKKSNIKLSELSFFPKRQSLTSYWIDIKIFISRMITNYKGANRRSKFPSDFHETFDGVCSHSQMALLSNKPWEFWWKSDGNFDRLFAP